MTDLKTRGSESRALENSEQEFMTRYAEFAATGALYPQIEGSPLLEFSAGGRVLYLFDRTGPYTAVPGAARVLVHGLLDLSAVEVLNTEPAQGENLNGVAVSVLEGVGQVLSASRRTWVVQARLPLVLSAFEVLPEVKIGQWVTFKTLPPLHGFLLGKP